MQGVDFLAQHPVFTGEDFRAFQHSRGSISANTQKNLLAHYEKRGKIVRIRRGTYATVPLGSTPEIAPVDPYLVASRLASDAVLAYHTALSFHGRAQSVWQRFEYLTSTDPRPLTWRSWQFRAIGFPPALCRQGQERFAVDELERSGLPVRVTSLERTLVDVLDRPDLGGGWEEIWRSLETVEYFNLECVIDYVVLLGNATTAAKVGYYMEDHREKLMVEDLYLKRLETLRPKEPHYLERHAQTQHKLVSRWNLVVPVDLVNRNWEQVL